VTIVSADSNDYTDISIQIYMTNLTAIRFVFRLRILISQPNEWTLRFNVTEQATVCTESNNSLSPLCDILSVCFNEYNYTKIALQRKSGSGI
jgi:hypothetical protein